MSDHIYVVDESGDPVFYSKRGKNIVGTDGCSAYLQFCLVRIGAPHDARKKIVQLANELCTDDLLRGVPSLEKKRDRFVFHACKDIPEIRDRFCRLLKTLDISAAVVHISKDEALFRSKYVAKPEVFYHEIVTELFVSGQSLFYSGTNRIYFEKRGTKNKQGPLLEAIKKGLSDENKHRELLVQVQTPTDEPCLQIADYINRVVQRAYIGEEPRFMNYLSEKIVHCIKT